MNGNLWTKLLQLRKQINLVGDAFRFCCFDLSSEDLPVYNQLTTHANSQSKQVVISKEKIQIQHSRTTLFYIDSAFDVHVHQQGNLTEAECHSLRIYLPYCLLPLIARKKNRAIAIAHFAQSLDGKIATFSGASQSIGNDENYKHAHRMRALCDGILVGSGTLKNDLPKLNVRLVEGNNPTRIVLGQVTAEDCQCLQEVSSDRILVISREVGTSSDIHQVITLPATNNVICCKKILETLYQQGINTVYIEGGAITTSHFLQESAIDILQLHIAPQIFGSGKQGICLPEIDTVKEAIHFENFSFEPVGNAMMFIGRLNSLTL